MLTSALAKAAAPRDRAYKLADAGGLYLFVAPSGLKSWRFKYRRQGREKLLVLGRFPAVQLAQARAARDAARAVLRAGGDPAAGNQDDSAGSPSFESLARAWLAHGAQAWSDAHAADVLASLERDVFPAIGDTPAASIEPATLLNVMRSVEARGCIETARRLRQRLSAVFGFGIAEGLIARDPAEHLGRAMRKGRPPRPMPALTSIEDCRALLAACEAVTVRAAVRLASRFLALTAVRLAAVRGMRWDEVRDLDGPEPLWIVPAARMKLARPKKDDARFDHAVPLCPPAAAVLRQALSIFYASDDAEKPDRLVFPGAGPFSPIGENALRDLYALTPFAGRHVPHGWRSSFSTILNEDLGPEWRGDIDRALGHAGMGKVEGAYNRAALLARRRALYDRWGAMLAAETS